MLELEWYWWVLIILGIVYFYGNLSMVTHDYRLGIRNWKELTILACIGIPIVTYAFVDDWVRTLIEYIKLSIKNNDGEEQ